METKRLDAWRFVRLQAQQTLATLRMMKLASEAVGDKLTPLEPAYDGMMERQYAICDKADEEMAKDTEPQPAHLEESVL